MLSFRFLNIPVHIHPTFWIFLLFFTNIYRDLSIESLIIGAVMIFSLLVHEYGHALTALYFGASPAITLEAFGGNAHYNPAGMTSKQHFLIVLNGPLLQSALIALSYSFLKSNLFAASPYIQYLLYVTMKLNILWCLFNLIPILPLDGGHLLRYLLEKKFGSRGHRASLLIGLASALLIAPYLFWQGFLFFGTFLLILAYQTFQLLKHTKAPTKTPYHSYLQGVEAIKHNDIERAKSILTKLLKSKDAAVKHSALETLAAHYASHGQPDQAYNLLLQADPSHLKTGKCLLCKLALERQNYTLVTQYAHDIYAIEPSFDIALLNSQAFAHLNDPALSGAWLYTASQFGPEHRPAIDLALQHPAYAPLRHDPSFQHYAHLAAAPSQPLA